jgi:hypothetical protein
MHVRALQLRTCLLLVAAELRGRVRQQHLLRLLGLRGRLGPRDLVTAWMDSCPAWMKGFGV